MGKEPGKTTEFGKDRSENKGKTASHPEINTGWLVRPDQTADKGWGGWRYCWVMGWWWNCRQHMPGQKSSQNSGNTELFSLCDPSKRRTHSDKGCRFSGVIPFHHFSGFHCQLVNRLEIIKVNTSRLQVECNKSQDDINCCLLTWMSCTNTGSRLQKVALASTQKLSCCSKSRPKDTWTRWGTTVQYIQFSIA